MSTNLTIDDSSPDIIYSSDWALQSSEDPQADRFFQSTYHSAQSDGSCANLTFTGSAIYLYGTKGPGHANYSVQFDNYITFSSASDAETRYQQPLFGYTFNTSGIHFISIKSIHADSNKWFDLDYLTITVNETDSNTTVASPSSSAPAPTASQSISPPWLSESSSTTGSSPSSSSGTSPISSSSASSSTSKTTLVLSIVFGSAIIAALIFALGFFFARRSKRRRDHQQMIGVGSPRSGAFSSYKPPSSPSFFGGGPLSPMSADLYTAHSPTSRTDPFHGQLSPGPDPDIPHAPVRTPGLDGRYSPYSALSMGGATVLTAASTAYLLNPQYHKAGDQLPKQIETDSTVGVGVGAEFNRSPRLRDSTDLPIYKKHRLFDSDTAIRALRGGSATALGLTRRLSGIPVKGTDGDVFDIHAPSPAPTPASGQTGVQAQAQAQPGSDYDKPRPAPIPPPPPPPPLHACHRSESDISSDVLPPPPPRRPKRPGDGLLDFIGSSLAQKLERSASAKRRKDDGNSERTDFLKV